MLSVVGFSRTVVKIGGAVGVNFDKGLSEKIDHFSLYNLYFEHNGNLLLVGSSRSVNRNGKSYCMTVDSKNNSLLGEVVNAYVEEVKK